MLNMKVGKGTNVRVINTDNGDIITLWFSSETKIKIGIDASKKYNIERFSYAELTSSDSSTVGKPSSSQEEQYPRKEY